jgi:hypothetical protein
MGTHHEHHSHGGRKPALTRRQFLRRSADVALAAAVTATSAGALLNSAEAWAVEVKGVSPEAMRVLLQMARDIYPHDQVADRFYAIALKGQDDKAAADPAHKALLEEGAKDLDARAGARGYLGLGWEEDRVAVLRQIEDTPFFQAIRGDLVVSLYNQPDVWPIFGYEGASAPLGGYLERGFDDIEWL